MSDPNKRAKNDRSRSTSNNKKEKLEKDTKGERNETQQVDIKISRPKPVQEPHSQELKVFTDRPPHGKRQKTPFRILKKYPKHTPKNKSGDEFTSDQESRVHLTEVSKKTKKKVEDEEQDLTDSSTEDDDEYSESNHELTPDTNEKGKFRQKKRHMVSDELEVPHLKPRSHQRTLSHNTTHFKSRKHIYARSHSINGVVSDIVSPSSTRLVWEEIPKSILIVMNKHNSEAVPFFKKICIYLSRVKMCHVVVEPSVLKMESIISKSVQSSHLHVEDVVSFNDENQVEVLNNVDIAICLGGDGTVLHTVRLFEEACPPILGFAMGSVGFLTVFDIKNYQQIIDFVFTKPLRISPRSRLYVEIERSDGTRTESHMVLNEVVCDRGPSPFLTTLDTFCSGRKITTVLADGLIIATPNGSSAYSMSAGGSIVHPSVPCILLTPICPHSLSFRPLILPDSSTLQIRVPETSRASAFVSFDGKVRRQLKKGDSIHIKTSKFPVPLICHSDETHEWFKNLSQCFNWNLRTQQRKFA